MINKTVREEIRLNVFLQKYGIASRRKADELIESGVVKVNGRIIKQLGTKISSDDAVSVNGKLLSKAPELVTYIFHKPYMTITSRKDNKERPTIYDLPELRSLPLNVQSVGRLDYKSEGLLILTNDGDLALTLSHPKYSVEKSYAVLVSTQITAEDIDKLTKGINLEDGLAKAISVKLGSKEKLGRSFGQWVELIVIEGRNRLIRRMLEALGLNVIRLVRISVGEIRLPTKLEAGKLRLITESEQKYLYSLKIQMLKSVKKENVLTNDLIAIRKQKRKTKINDEDYKLVVQHRQITNSQLSKKRKLAKEATIQDPPKQAPKSPRAKEESNVNKDNTQRRVGASRVGTRKK